METRGLLSRVSVRGILTDAHNEISHTQIDALNSMLYSAICTFIYDRSLEDRKGVERIDLGSSANYHRIRE